MEKHKHSDGKTFWEIKGNEVEVIRGERFLKLARRSIAHGFARLCIEADGALPDMGKEWSMSTYRGYVALVKERNKVQTMSLLEMHQQDVPELFKGGCLSEGWQSRDDQGPAQRAKAAP